jgi:ribosomal protein S18 acetylase RimI-like enzyme
MLPFFTTRTMSSNAAVSGGGLLRSASSPWIRFTWQTAGVPDFVRTDSSDVVRPATKEEAQKVSEVILNSLSLDSAWNGSFVKVEQYLKDAVVRLFSKDEPLCLVVPKGNRLIAASLLDPDPEASSHLLSGPAVLPEYRNRGIGTQLLYASLVALRDRDLATINGITRANTTGSRHVYTKFGGVGESIKLPPSVEVSEETKI